MDQTERRIPVTGWWWASFDWARSPFYYVIVIYVFSTYFAQTVVGEPRGARRFFPRSSRLRAL